MKKKGKHLLYKDPELIKNNEGGFIVNFNSVAASGFLTLKDPFNSTYLKLMKNRIVYYQGQRNEIMEENPNIQLDEGFSKLAKIEKMWGISEPFPKMMDFLPLDMRYDFFFFDIFFFIRTMSLSLQLRVMQM